MSKKKKRMLTIEEMLPHPLPLHHHLKRPLLPCLRDKQRGPYGGDPGARSPDAA
jgi:hypothetical protein